MEIAAADSWRLKLFEPTPLPPRNLIGHIMPTVLASRIPVLAARPVIDIHLQ